MKNIHRKTQNLRNAGLPLARATRYAAQKQGMPAWATGGLILAFVGTVGVFSVTALGLTQDDTPIAMAIPTPEEVATLQQTASAIETITAARVARPVASAQADFTAPTTSFETTSELPEVVTRQQTSVLAIAPTTTPPSAPAVLETSCIRDLGALLDNNTVPFAVSSTDVDPAMTAGIRIIATRASTCPNVQIVVEGHSDASGSGYDNIQLSWQRAEAVIALIGDMGFDTSIYEPMGFGARFAPEPTDDAAQSENIRRVSFRMIPVINQIATLN